MFVCVDCRSFRKLLDVLSMTIWYNSCANCEDLRFPSEWKTKRIILMSDSLRAQYSIRTQYFSVPKSSCDHRFANHHYYLEGKSFGEIRKGSKLFKLKVSFMKTTIILRKNSWSWKMTAIAECRCKGQTQRARIESYDARPRGHKTTELRNDSSRGPLKISWTEDFHKRGTKFKAK